MRTDEAMTVENLHATLRGEIEVLNKSHADLARRLADASRKIESDAKVIAALREAQWPDEATEEMKQAIYALDLGDNRLSEDDVIDIYDTLRKVVLGTYEQTAGETK